MTIETKTVKLKMINFINEDQYVVATKITTINGQKQENVIYRTHQNVWVDDRGNKHRSPNSGYVHTIHGWVEVD